jgi:proline dehydrogenase
LTTPCAWFAISTSGILTSLDLLGEGVGQEVEARRAASAYVALLETISACQVNSNISIKLTQLGLDISPALCADNLRLILLKASQLGNFVRIDMESSKYSQLTLDLFTEFFAAFKPHVGVVIQSYLRRTERDATELARLGCNVRLCKGAYLEPPTVAFPRKADVDANYLRVLEILLDSKAYTAIATHDSAMIDHARRFIAANRIPSSAYEFQMLYGVRSEYQLDLVRQGFRVRVYVPYGRHWAPFFMRRLAERPANVLFVVKNLWRR